jgi:hypothetical protein
VTTCLLLQLILTANKEKLKNKARNKETVKKSENKVKVTKGGKKRENKDGCVKK